MISMNNNQRKGIVVMFSVTLMVAILSIAGCLDEEKKDDLLEIMDQTGNSLELDGTPEVIVTLTPAMTEIVVELGAGSIIAGADSVSVSENPSLSLETVSTWEGLDSEKLVETLPDLVLMDKTLDITEANYNKITDLSIPVYRAFPTDFNSVLTLIDDIGYILDREDEADLLTTDMQSRADEIEMDVTSIADADRPEVLYITYYDGTSDPWVGTSSTFSGNIMEMAGGKNVIGDGTGVVIQVSVETIIDADPDVIITSQSSSWPTPTRDTILSSDTWKDITAVKNEKVIDVNGDHIDRTGPHLIDGLEAVHDALYT
jgi:iron complex transport system substrate-binding protein